MSKTLSLIIPTLNEETNILPCLNSIAKQTYPHAHIEIIIADALSTDNTLALIQAWSEQSDITLKVITNTRIVAEFGKAQALKHASGDFLCVLDCDEEIVQDDALETYVNAFNIFPDIVGVEQYFLKVPGGHPLNNYLAICQINDPLAREIATLPHLLDTRTIEDKTFRLYEFSPAYPALLFFKREAIADLIEADTYEEGQVMLHLARTGRNRMCMVDGYGVWHRYVDSFAAYFRKRAKIALKHTTRIQERETWVSHTGGRMYFCALLHLTILYPLAYSLLMAVRRQEPLWLLHAPTCFLTTLIYAVNWIWIKITGKKAWSRSDQTASSTSA